MRLGVFGGTFDPVHAGHLVAAETAREAATLDAVMFVPAGQPWLKDGDVLGGKRDRMRMVELAIEGNSQFLASDMELHRPGPTYSADTLEELVDRRPGDELFLIVGMDALGDFDRWSRPRRVLELAKLVAVARPGHSGLDAAQLDGISPGASGNVIAAVGPVIGVSATDVRRRLGRGASIRYLVPKAVESYIYRHGMYGATRVSSND